MLLHMYLGLANMSSSYVYCSFISVQQLPKRIITGTKLNITNEDSIANTRTNKSAKLGNVY